MVSRRKVISSPHRPPISPLTTLPPTFRLAAQSSTTPPLAAAIVTNPPFKHAEAMLRHAVAIGIEYLVFLHVLPQYAFAQIANLAIVPRPQRSPGSGIRTERRLPASVGVFQFFRRYAKR